MVGQPRYNFASFVNCANTVTDVVSACDSYTWMDSVTYTASNNTAMYTLMNTAGCDSIVLLDLTINASNAGTDIINACDSFTWIDNVTYTASNNTATHTVLNAAGCDSLVTLDLTIISSNFGTDIITACDSYTWIDSVTYTSSNNTATHTVSNSVGCDSLVSLDLTINSSSARTDVVAACDSYTWMDGITYTASNNTATLILTNSVGCDSIIALDLTINAVSDITTTTNGATITANNPNAACQWLDCNNGMAAIPGETNRSFTATANGNYAVELTENGCVENSFCVAITNISVVNWDYSSQISVFPNPTRGVFRIAVPKTLVGETMELLNTAGQVINIFTLNSTTADYELHDYASGIYFIRLQTPAGLVTKKLIKH